MGRQRSRGRTYEGLPVPWIALWSGEVYGGTPIGWTVASYEDAASGEVTKLMIPRIDGRWAEWDDERDHLWLRNGQSMNGTPYFGQVNVQRQRRAITERLCQVCGERVKGDLTWVLTDRQAESLPVVETPPTCSACIEVARRHCPAVSSGSNVYVVRSYEPYGIFGLQMDVADLPAYREWGESNTTTPPWMLRRVPYGDPRVLGMIAYQQLVRWTDYTDSTAR